MKLSQENKKALKSLGLNPDCLYDVQKWLRDYYDVDIEICRSVSNLRSYYYKITVNNDLTETQTIIDNKTYEETLQEAVNRALDIKNKYILCSSFTINQEPGRNLKNLVLENFIENCKTMIKEVDKDYLYTPMAYSWYKSLCMGLIDISKLVKIKEFKYTDFKSLVNRKLLEKYGRGNYEYLFGAGEFPFILGTIYKKDQNYIVTYKIAR